MVYNYHYGEDDRYLTHIGYVAVPVIKGRTNKNLGIVETRSLKKARISAIRMLAYGTKAVSKVTIYKAFSDGFAIELEDIKGIRNPVAIPYTFREGGRPYIKAGTKSREINLHTGALVKLSSY